MQRRSSLATATWIVLGAASTISIAAEPSGGQACAVIDDAGSRLACYDEAFGRTDGGVESKSLLSGDAARGQEEFGLSEMAIRARDPEKARETLPESITAAVTEIGRRPTGELVVTLDNGHVWTQIEVDSKGRVKVGDTVTVRKASLGSYLLITPNRIATRVRRVK